MPSEMIEWIKDSTILWVKNKGAGNSTTESEIMNAEGEDKMQMMKEYYE